MDRAGLVAAIKKRLPPSPQHEDKDSEMGGGLGPQEEEKGNDVNQEQREEEQKQETSHVR